MTWTTKPTGGHHLKLILAATAVVFLWLLYRLGLPQSPEQHLGGIPDSKPAGENGNGYNSILGMHPDVLSEEAAQQFCTNFRLEPFPRAQAGRRKIYDLLLINTELELLDVRLGQMSPGVDYFVILESDRTFTDQAKPLFVQDNWSRFAKYHRQMIRRTMDRTTGAFQDTWAREGASRNAMYDQVVPYLTGEQAANRHDIVLVSDVDEMFKPEVLKALRNCDVPDKVTAMSRMFYYSFQWLQDKSWPHPQATVYKGENETILPNTLRKHSDSHFVFPEGGWHCSYCFSTLAEMIKKITSFSHTEMDRPEFKDPLKIIDRVRHGKYMFDRSLYTRIERNFDVPDFLHVGTNSEKYGFMLSRDPPNANFKDWDPKTQTLLPSE
ncbi:family 17 glycosyltransferase [Coniochaeta sp. 2T2.1]|nr:family 17 glycosyltransferase [Coniochaeta sp. 2T2.1]